MTANTAGLSPPTITVEAWAKSKTATWNEFGYIVSKRFRYVLHPNAGSTRVDFRVWVNGVERTISYEPISGFDITQWHHYVGTFDGVVARLYVDGVDVSAVPYAGTVAADTGPLFIGRDDGFARWGSAFIDDVAVYPTALRRRGCCCTPREAQGAARSPAQRARHMFRSPQTPARRSACASRRATLQGGPVNADSAQTAAVTTGAPSPPANTVLPVVSGTAQVGQTLTGTDRTWARDGADQLCAAVAALQRCDLHQHRVCDRLELCAGGG